ncbi:MAG: slipin family protein, partial [Burkholderiales bacterium]
AKVIYSEGEAQAAEKLLEAGAKLATQPEAMQLRYLQILTEIASDKSNTIVFPVPVNLLGALGELVKRSGN